MEEYAIQLGLALAQNMAENTFDWVRNKSTAAKLSKDMQSQQLAYEEIINSLISGKTESNRIAQEYKSLYEKVTISDDDIEHLHNTINSILKLFVQFNPQSNLDPKSFNVALGLLSKDTLKTMQLLGFNYKDAIGQPLTEVCSSFIHSKFNSSKTTNPFKPKK